MTTVSPSLTLHSRPGRRILALLCAVAFLDFVDASITNVALPRILTSLHFSVQSLQWVPSAAALIALATTNTRVDPNETHGAELQADPLLAAAAPEPITKEIQ